MSTITIGISDLNVGKGQDILVTYALGSCVGICLYDPVVKIGGLSHIMLPESATCQIQPTDTRGQMKFADTAIPMLVKKLELMGCVRRRMHAKIAGGAQMFASMNNTAVANVGQRNVVAVKSILAQLRIPIVAEDTGKNYGRTLRFFVEKDIMQITSATRGEWSF